MGLAEPGHGSWPVEYAGDPRASLRTERQGENFLAEISLPLALRD
ncbi:hypothetical protein ACHAC9_11350 [Massilia sp. CMS3.1]